MRYKTGLEALNTYKNWDKGGDWHPTQKCVSTCLYPKRLVRLRSEMLFGRHNIKNGIASTTRALADLILDAVIKDIRLLGQYRGAVDTMLDSQAQVEELFDYAIRIRRYVKMSDINSYNTFMLNEFGKKWMTSLQESSTVKLEENKKLYWRSNHRLHNSTLGVRHRITLEEIRAKRIKPLKGKSVLKK